VPVGQDHDPGGVIRWAVIVELCHQSSSAGSVAPDITRAVRSRQLGPSSDTGYVVSGCAAHYFGAISTYSGLKCGPRGAGITLTTISSSMILPLMSGDAPAHLSINLPCAPIASRWGTCAPARPAPSPHRRVVFSDHWCRGLLAAVDGALGEHTGQLVEPGL
jgi:hypothetical protein